MSGGTVGVREYLSASMKHAEWARNELEEVRRRLAKLPFDLDEATRALRDAADNFAKILLPALEKQHLQEARRRTSWRPAEDPVERRETERSELRAEVAAIEANPTYQRRDALLDDVVGEIPLEERRLEDDRAPLDAVWDRLQHPRLERLIDAGYGTQAYAVPWWRAAYYADWKAGDEILEKFPEKHTGKPDAFGELREMYLHLKEARAAIDEQQRAVLGRRQDVQGLVDRHDRAERRLETLDADHLALARGQLAEHVADLPYVNVGSRLQDAPELDVLMKRLDGLRAKRLYFEDMKKDLERMRGELQQVVGQCAKDQVKYSRPKKASMRFPADKVAHRFRDRRPRSQKYWERYDRGYSRVREFDDYSGASIVDDFLWWDYMTDGCHAPHVHSVSVFHEHHPDYRWQGWDDADAAAAIAGAPDRDGPLVDAS